MKIKTSLATPTVATIMAATIPLVCIGGIQGSGRNFAMVAAVTATGPTTVSVGGVPYSDSGASLQVDGQTGSPSQVQVGDVVTAYGHAGNGKQPDTIDTLILNHALKATVDSVDVAGGTFSAAGQTVRVDSGTVLNPVLALLGLSALVPGSKVQVSGWTDATGTVVASRLDVLAFNASSKVSGEVSSLDASRHLFKINQLTVDFSGSEVEGLIQEGSDVLVAGTTFDSTGALLAQQVQIVQPLQVSTGETGRLQGVVTSITSPTEFDVDGQPVEVNSATQLKLHGPVTLNGMVKVDGVFDANGVLVASTLQTKNSNGNSKSK